MTEIICPQCGSENKKESNHCVNCGCAISETQANDSKTESSHPENMMSVDEFSRKINQSQYKIIQLIQKGEYKGKIVGDSWYINEIELYPEASQPIGGLLILPAIALIFASVVCLFSIFRSIPSIILDASHSATYIIVNLYCAGLSIYSIYLFFLKRTSAPKTIIILIYSLLFINILKLLLGVIWENEYLIATGVLGSLIVIIIGGIWIPYFVVSKRVKATFTRKPVPRIRMN